MSKDKKKLATKRGSKTIILDISSEMIFTVSIALALRNLSTAANFLFKYLEEMKPYQRVMVFMMC